MAQQCKATSKSTGKRCEQPVVKGKEVCRYHGGKSLSGTAHPNYRHGGRTRVALAGASVRERFEAAMADPDRHRIEQDVATVEMRLQELLANLPAGGTGDALQELEGWRARLAEARQIQDRNRQGAAVAELLNEVGPLVDRLRSIQATWREIGTQVDRRARLLESAARLEQTRAQVFSAEQVMVMLAQVAEVVARKHREAGVDRRVTNEIGIEVAAIVDGAGRVLPDQPGG